MNRMPSSRKRQQGAVAIIVGLSIVILVGMLALVVDLGHLYIAKTELQNAADAAALAGAKELDGTKKGVENAVKEAEKFALKNNYDFSKPVVITIANISVGSTPDNMVPASSVITDNDAINKTFLKVDTGVRELDTWFAPVLGLISGNDFDKTRTFGMAVAGRYAVDIAPIAICSVNVQECPCLPDQTSPCGGGNRLCGFEPGKSYHFMAATGVNPIGPGTPLWIDAYATSVDTCDFTNTEASRQPVCTGKSTISTTPGHTIYTNTGLSNGPLFGALDSRFGDYPSQAQCDPASAPPDTNIREFAYQLFADVASEITGKNPYKNQPTMPDWLDPAPDLTMVYPQTPNCTVTGLDQYGANIYNCPWMPNGVYWSASRRDPAVAAPSVTTNYPATGTPYSQTSGDYFRTGGSNAVPERRMLNMMIVQCESAGGVCRPATNRMVGKFLLQTRASVANDVNVEFIREISQSELTREIRLFR